MAKCTCFEDTLARMKQRVIDQLTEKGIEYSDLEVEWQDYAFFFGGGDHVPVNPVIKVEYRGVKKNKEPMKNLTKQTSNILCSYCPFCGRKLGEEDKVAPENNVDAIETQNEPDRPMFTAMHVHDEAIINRPDVLEPHMQKLFDVCNKSPDWQLALCAISQGNDTITLYHEFMKHWPEFHLVPNSVFEVIYAMYYA